jgi:hypothetical protein
MIFGLKHLLPIFFGDFNAPITIKEAVLCPWANSIII